MRHSKVYDAVLFSVERGSYPYKYRLYFAVYAQHGEQPQLHRFYVRSKKIFESFHLGGRYHLEYRGIRITSAQEAGLHSFTDMEYFDLLRLRDLQFMNSKSQKQLNVKSVAYDPSELYYTFKVYKSLVEYRPEFIRAFVVNLCKLACYFISFFIPIGLYLLLIYFFSASGLSQSSSGLNALTIPIAAICLLAFTIWMMYAFNIFISLLLLNIGYMRPYLLRQHTLRWAGMRKSCYLEHNVRLALIKGGLITFVLASASVVLLYAL